MSTLVMHTTHTATGFACCCDLLPGWTTSHGHNFDKFDRYVRESVDFYVKCAREDGDEYPGFLDAEYEIIYDFDVCGLLNYYQGILSFAGLQLVSQNNGIYTFLNQLPKNFSFDEVDKTKMAFTTAEYGIKKIGQGVRLTDEAQLSGYGNPMGTATNQIALSISEKLDNDRIDVLCHVFSP